MDAGLTVRLFPVTAVPLRLNETAFVAVQLSVVLPPAVIGFVAAEKLAMSGAGGADCVACPPPEQAGATANNSKAKAGRIIPPLLSRRLVAKQGSAFPGMIFIALSSPEDVEKHETMPGTRLA